MGLILNFGATFPDQPGLILTDWTLDTTTSSFKAQHLNFYGYELQLSLGTARGEMENKSYANIRHYNSVLWWGQETRIKKIINIHFSLITKSVILWSNNQTDTFNSTPLMACVLSSPRLSWVRVWPSAGVGMRCTDFPVSCLRTCSQCRGVRGHAWYMDQPGPVTTWFISPDSRQ